MSINRRVQCGDQGIAARQHNVPIRLEIGQCYVTSVRHAQKGNANREVHLWHQKHAHIERVAVDAMN